ncbi:MAG: hypothetical protein VXY16_04000 [Pseudomonadota bacterium]|nr:hypothetical protein [Pseudomonadota bacterium]
MSEYIMGMAIGISLGIVIGLPTSEEDRAIDAFNSNAVYYNTETSQLCLRETPAANAPTAACIDYTP